MGANPLFWGVVGISGVLGVFLSVRAWSLNVGLTRLAVWWAAWIAGSIICAQAMAFMVGRERSSVQKMLSAFTETYALECAALGHSEIQVEGDDANTRISAAMRRWMAANPRVASIYSMRKGTDGKVSFVVCPEADLDKSGTINTEEEQAVPFGEPYEEMTPALEASFSGQSMVDSEPTTDKWGQWLSSSAPIIDESGKVEAILGVDYPAAVLLDSEAKASWFGLVLTFVIQFMLSTMGTAWVWGRARAKERQTQSELLEEANRQIQEQYAAISRKNAELASSQVDLEHANKRLEAIVEGVKRCEFGDGRAA